MLILIYQMLNKYPSFKICDELGSGVDDEIGIKLKRGEGATR